MRFPLTIGALLVVWSTASGQTPTRRLSIGPNLRLAPGEFNEPWIAASSSHRNVLVAAAHPNTNSVTAQDIHAFLSRDGGRTWTRVNLPGGTSGFDPMVASGPDGRLYVLAGQRSAAYWAWYARLSGVDPTLKYPDAKPLHRVWSATGEAWSWSEPTEVPAMIDPDHGRIVVDMSQGPRRGRLYLLWNDAVDVFVPDHYEMVLQHSDDGGRTFSERQLVDVKRGGKLVATEPVVLSDGTLLVSYYQYYFPMNKKWNQPWPFFIRRSTDGGKTFGPVENPFSLGPNLAKDPAGEFGGFMLPIVVADSSSASPYRDNIYITWDDVGAGESNIWLVRSTDKGRTWSEPLRINDNRTGGSPVRDYRMISTVAVNHRGEVAVGWYDRRNDPTHQCYEYFIAFSTDGGRTFSPNRPVSTAPSCPPPNLAPAITVNNLSESHDPNLPPDSALARMTTVEHLLTIGDAPSRRMREEAAKGIPNGRINISFKPSRSIGVGDYAGLAADIDGGFHALWIDRRNGKPELYTARISLGDTASPTQLAEQDVTSRVEIVTGPATFDRAQGLVKFPVQVRNVSEDPIHGPISVRILGVKQAGGRPTASLVDSAVARSKAPALSFDGKLGTENVLGPLDLSEPVMVALKTQATTGWDASLDVRVTGRVER